MQIFAWTSFIPRVVCCYHALVRRSLHLSACDIASLSVPGRETFQKRTELNAKVIALLAPHVSTGVGGLSKSKIYPWLGLPQVGAHESNVCLHGWACLRWERMKAVCFMTGWSVSSQMCQWIAPFCVLPELHAVRRFGPTSWVQRIVCATYSHTCSARTSTETAETARTSRQPRQPVLTLSLDMSNQRYCCDEQCPHLALQRQKEIGEIDEALAQLRDNLVQEQRAATELEFLVYKKLLTPVQGGIILKEAFPIHNDCITFANIVFFIESQQGWDRLSSLATESMQAFCDLVRNSDSALPNAALQVPSHGAVDLRCVAFRVC